MPDPTLPNPTLPDLTNDPTAKRVVKRPIPVHAKFAAAPGTIQTPEGKVSHQAGDAVLTGIRGEQWPVARARFLATYEPVPGTSAGEDGTYQKRRIIVLARSLSAPTKVPTGSGDTLQGAPGDWLVQHGPAEFGVVAADIFAETYEPAAMLPAKPRR